MTLFEWLGQTGIDEDVKPGVTAANLAGLRQARERVELLDQKNEVLCRAAAYLSGEPTGNRWYLLVNEFVPTVALSR